METRMKKMEARSFKEISEILEISLNKATRLAMEDCLPGLLEKKRTTEKTLRRYDVEVLKKIKPYLQLKKNDLLRIIAKQIDDLKQ